MAATALVPLVCRGRLTETSLAGEVVIVTGGGGGIGLEAARSLLQLGASVAIAEVDVRLCAAATDALIAQAGSRHVMAVQTDVADESSVRELVKTVIARFGKIDAVVNNATYAPAGASVTESPVDAWDRSYAVNLRGPVLLARECLTPMIERKHGVFVCVSSTGGPFLAPYETLKAAQVALANALDAELADTGVVAFTIGPGLVATPTAVAAIERIAPRLGMSVDEFWRTNGGAVVSVDAAGAGFAAAVAMADRYAGQEISSTQALIDAGINASEAPVAAPDARACARVLKTLQEQAADWQKRSFFERQWMLRDFKHRAGVPVERCIEMLAAGRVDRTTAEKLALFYDHMGELAAGYVKDPKQRDEQVAITRGWAAEARALAETLPKP